MLAVGQVLFKIAAQQSRGFSQEPLSFASQLFRTPVFLTACLLYALSTIVWVGLLGRFPLSLAYPLVIAISIVLTTCLGITFFHEQPSLDKTMGLLLVVAGVSLLSRSLA